MRRIFPFLHLAETQRKCESSDCRAYLKVFSRNEILYFLPQLKRVEIALKDDEKIQSLRLLELSTTKVFKRLKEM